ncbi:GOLPH3/VPS74 family protein [Amycolatopsis sacchari]|uniref:GOLPH3/VPS74 family protein n=1 Tax=Amycolatopsis sacchari TaxID=115433 RepID=UPI003D754416
MNPPESLPARMFLLAFHPEKHRLTARKDLGHLLRAAALAELVLSGRLRDADGKPEATGAPPRDPVLAAVWGQIAESAPKSWGRWISRGRKEIFGAVRDELAAARVISVERARVLGVVPYTRITLRDRPRAKRQAELVRRAVRGSQAPSRVDGEVAALTALAAAGQLRVVVPGRDRRQYRDRLEALSAPITPVTKALRRAIRAQHAAQSSGG